MSKNNNTLSDTIKTARWFTQDTWIGYALILPAIIVMSIIIIYPIIRAVYVSFTEKSYLRPDDSMFVGLENYQALWGDATFWVALWQTVLLTAGAVGTMYLLALGLALLLNQKLPAISLFRSMSMVSWVIPPIVIVITWDWIFQVDYGLLNIIFGYFDGPNRYWFGAPDLALGLIGMMRVWKDVPFVAIALLAAMQSIPEEYYEAAELDGAGALQKFRYVTLPHIAYISMIMIVIEVIAVFNTFDFVWLATGGGPGNSTEVLGTYIYRQAFEFYTLGYASAIGVVMLLILAVFTVVYLRLEETE